MAMDGTTANNTGTGAYGTTTDTTNVGTTGTTTDGTAGRYSPYNNTDTNRTTGNNFRTYANANDNTNWSWLGLLGLIGLAGLFGRNRERNDA